MSNLDFSVITPYFPMFLKAASITLQVGIGAFILAVVIAIIVGTLRTKRLPKVINFLLGVYVEFFRGTPLLIQLFVVYYGLPSFGIKVPAMAASIMTIGINSGAYLSEAVRASILAIDKGQYEAASVLGYNSVQTTVHIILPQALRIVIPSFMNGFSSMVKETSLISVLPIIEMTKLGNQIYAKTYHPFEIYITLAIVYFAMTYSVTFLAKWLERRLSVWVN